MAKYAARGKMYLVMLAPFEDGIAMHQLYYEDEVVPFSEVPLTDGVELKEGELALAMQLINQIAAEDFRPDEYEDEVKKRMEAVIQQKIDGEAITVSSSEAPKAQIIDLMDALKASLGVADAPAEESEPRPAKKAKSKKKDQEEESFLFLTTPVLILSPPMATGYSARPGCQTPGSPGGTDPILCSGWLSRSPNRRDRRVCFRFFGLSASSYGAGAPPKKNSSGADSSEPWPGSKPSFLKGAP